MNLKKSEKVLLIHLFLVITKVTGNSKRIQNFYSLDEHYPGNEGQSKGREDVLSTDNIQLTEESSSEKNYGKTEENETAVEQLLTETWSGRTAAVC